MLFTNLISKRLSNSPGPAASWIFLSVPPSPIVYVWILEYTKPSSNVTNTNIQIMQNKHATVSANTATK